MRVLLSSWMLCSLTGCTEPNPNLDSGTGSTGSGGTSVSPSSDDENGGTVSDAESSGATAVVSDGASDSSSSTAGDSGMGSSSGGGGVTDADSSTTTGSTLVCDLNGVLEVGELCDDDNSFEGDGCHHCQPEMGFHCIGEPSQCFIECDPLDSQCVRGIEICIPIAEASPHS